MNTVRTRFAPSPTGYLHVGGARTALYAWLYAKQHAGQFVLRVEDTDRERSSEDSVRAILDGMKWLGLAADEGPIYQSARFERYRAVAAELLATGAAYVCQCSRERLSALREAQLSVRQKPRYDGHCRDLGLDPSGDCVLRLRNPRDGAVSWDDAVHGRIEIANSELDDLIILRSDGTPTYNFCVVVDDLDMGISHVIRGDDHINNTPRQINLIRALGGDTPVFAHLPMILGDDGKRLSKRHGAVSVLAFRQAGYLPEALLNYLARLGWSHGDQELFSREQLLEHFSLAAVNRAGASFDTGKLDWLNSHYLKALPGPALAQGLAGALAEAGVEIASGPAIEPVAELLRERGATFSAMAAQARFFYLPPLEYEAKAAAKHLKPAAAAPLSRVRAELAVTGRWAAEDLHAAIQASAEALGLGFGKVALPLRIVTTGGTASPELDRTLALLGRERVLERIDAGLAWLAARE